ncbi:hypothetical protein C5H23_02800 [Xylella fastidiosa]|nr:hypothetical protein P303_11420 [Xylella fastidiosa MUL0034]TNV90516.1 hypothetical protein C5H23_02800 [Xylella fastidiosa]TNV91867.1 hypothetical protein C5H22_13360 [Xylella fastidiosa]TNV97599.1 hypothetical protein C5H21_12640 [Xylella fastidiosa]
MTHPFASAGQRVPPCTIRLTTSRHAKNERIPTVLQAVQNRVISSPMLAMSYFRTPDQKPLLLAFHPQPDARPLPE